MTYLPIFSPFLNVSISVEFEWAKVTKLFEMRKGNASYHYLVTEFYRGNLLSESVGSEGPFDLEDAVQITLCVLSGLSFIHSRALIHNDIRPSNIMLQELDDGMLMPPVLPNLQFGRSERGICNSHV